MVDFKKRLVVQSSPVFAAVCPELGATPTCVRFDRYCAQSRVSSGPVIVALGPASTGGLVDPLGFPLHRLIVTLAHLSRMLRI